jgi:tetratricopeptide (TPR) repeat protein
MLTMSLAAAGEVTMTITSPAEGKTVSWPNFSARLPGLTDLVVVRVDCAGATHFIMVQPVPPGPAPRPGQRVNEPVANDSWFPIVLGKQELTAAVFSKDGKELVAKQKVVFTVEKQSDADLAKGLYGFNRAYGMLNGAANSLSEARESFCNCFGNAVRDRTTENWAAVRRQAVLYMATRSNEFHTRLNAYADLSYTYRSAGRPADAMRAAHEADRIYEAEKGYTTTGEFFSNFPAIYDPRPEANVRSPAHFIAMARLYAMKGDLNTVLSWYEKAIAFQSAQAQAGHLNAGAKQRCLDEAATTCRQAASLAFLLTNDMAKYQQLMDRANRISTGNAGGGGGVNLLGQ